MSRRPCEEILEQRIGYRFCESSLLCESLTHKSFSNEQRGRTVPHNERLEFLGDAVLDLAISQIIFRDFPGLDEGEMTRIRAEVVSEKGIAAVARGLELGDCLQLGRGEARSGGRKRASLLADALEALIGAVFRDGGFDPASKVADALFSAAVARSARCKLGIDHKTRLQEILQARHGGLPLYRLLGAEGPDHDRVYSVAVFFDGETIGLGEGRTKKGAEQEAARQALGELERRESGDGSQESGD